MAKIHNCRVCGSEQVKQFFDLGEQPLANSLLGRLNQKEETYPPSLSWCPDCNLVQLDYTADPQQLFSYYVWVTSTSKTVQEFSRRFYQELISRAAKSWATKNQDTYNIKSVADRYWQTLLSA